VQESIVATAAVLVQQLHCVAHDRLSQRFAFGGKQMFLVPH
jgi:hypothetical protein